MMLNNGSFRLPKIKPKHHIRVLSGDINSSKCENKELNDNKKQARDYRKDSNQV